MALTLILLYFGYGAAEGPRAQTPPEPTPVQTRPAAGTAIPTDAQGDEPPEAAEPTRQPQPTWQAEADQIEQPGPVIPADYDYSQPVPQAEPVEDDYFADAAFLGDSRVDGFRLYSGLTKADFVVKPGMSVFKVHDDLLVYKGEEMTALEALGRKEYGKVYVSLGVNELGMRDDQGYYDCYARLIDDIRAQQPQAIVYIQLLVPVNAKKCAEKQVAYYVTNEQIATYNSFLCQLAQDKQVFLVDPAQVLVDETGQPPYDTVTDGVHFTRARYGLWLDYLKCHTVQEGEGA